MNIVTVTCAVRIHEKGHEFEGVEIQMVDEGAGAFFEIHGEPGKVRVTMEELEAAVVAARQMYSQAEKESE